MKKARVGPGPRTKNRGLRKAEFGDKELSPGAAWGQSRDKSRTVIRFGGYG
jgi:hypothetical protein